MNYKKYFSYLPLLLLACFCLMGVKDCDSEPTTDMIQTQQTEKLQQEAQRQSGLPNITRFQQKKIMKLIMEQCDKADLITYVYLKSDYYGKLTFIGKAIGYGVPFSAQYTNPERIYRPYSGHYLTLPQPDPNGLFMPTSSSATWLMMVDPKTNKAKPVYLEPEIVVSPFQLHK